MNRKRRRGKPAKIGHVNNHLLEGKTHITANRVTIRPGFLSKGIASETVRKPKTTQRRENILNEDLQSFFDRNNLRRSERISKKYDTPKSNRHSGPLRQRNEYSRLPISPLNIKPCDNNNILVRNNSKSIFKEINEKYIELPNRNINCNSQVDLRDQHILEEYQKDHNQIRNQEFVERLQQNFMFDTSPKPKISKIIPETKRIHLLDVQIIKKPHSSRSIEENDGFPEQPQSFLKNPFQAELNQEEEEVIFKKPVLGSRSKSPINKSFCAEVQRQISFKLSKNDRVDVFHRIDQEIEKTNLVLQGKMNYEDMYCSEKYQPDNADEEMWKPFMPYPRRSWVFNTPPSQKLVSAKLEESNGLQTGVLYSSKRNHQYLYELKPEMNVKLNEFRHRSEQIPIDNRFVNCVAHTNRPQLNEIVGFDNNVQGCLEQYMPSEPERFVQNNNIPIFQNQNGYNLQYVGLNQGYEVGYSNGETKIQAPQDVGAYTMISRPNKTQQTSRIHPNTLKIQPRNLSRDDFEPDLTFVEENGAFRLQQSQNNAKRRNEEPDLLGQRRKVIDIHNKNLFNFDQEQENADTNLFSFE